MDNREEQRVFSITNSEVKLWTSEYIPFEPSGWKKELKQELRDALGSMNPRPGDGLYASYQARQAHFCDIENVLLYNIGSGAFSHLATTTLCLEGRLGREYEPAREAFPHLYHYQLTAAPTYQLWTPKQTIAQWVGDKVSRVEQTPAFFWHYVKCAQAIICSDQVDAEFGVNVIIRTPRSSLNIANIIKPMLDGIICAFHQHHGAASSEVNNVLSKQLGIREQEIECLLADDRCNVLGSRNVVQSYRTGVKWNPADDRCLAIKIEIEYMADSWQIGGQLFSIV